MQNNQTGKIAPATIRWSNQSRGGAKATSEIAKAVGDAPGPVFAIIMVSHDECHLTTQYGGENYQFAIESLSRNQVPHSIITGVAKEGNSHAKESSLENPYNQRPTL